MDQILPKFKSNIQTHIFDNGLRLIYEKPHTSLPITSIHAYCNIGSANEIDGIRGAAHFIEHMCFKGTKKIPQPRNIYLAYDEAGAVLNAMTEKRYTVYLVKTAADFTHNCIDMLSDMMLNSVFHRENFVKEEKVVIEEVLRTADDAEDIVGNLSGSVIYSGSSYAFPVDTVEYHQRPFSYSKIVDIYRLFYRPENIILSIVSSLPFSQIIHMVNTSYFARKMAANMNNNPYNIIVPAQPNNTNGGIIYRMKSKPNTQTIHLNISFRTCSIYSDDWHTLSVLRHILSGTFGSILSTLLRDKNGLTYTSNANSTYYEHTGDFTIYVQVDHHKILKNGKKQGVLPIIIQLLNQLVNHGISANELKIAKQNIRGKMTIGLENSMTQSRHNGLEWLLYSDVNKIVPVDKLYDVNVKPITVKNIHDVIRKYFHKTSMFVCMVGDHLPSQALVEHECEQFLH